MRTGRDEECAGKGWPSEWLEKGKTPERKLIIIRGEGGNGKQESGIEWMIFRMASNYVCFVTYIHVMQCYKIEYLILNAHQLKEFKIKYSFMYMYGKCIQKYHITINIIKHIHKHIMCER